MLRHGLEQKEARIAIESKSVGRVYFGPNADDAKSTAPGALRASSAIDRTEESHIGVVFADKSSEDTVTVTHMRSAKQVHIKWPHQWDLVFDDDIGFAALAMCHADSECDAGDIPDPILLQDRFQKKFFLRSDGTSLYDPTGGKVVKMRGCFVDGGSGRSIEIGKH